MKLFRIRPYFLIALVGLLSACGVISGTASDVVPSETGAAKVHADPVSTNVDLPLEQLRLILLPLRAHKSPLSPKRIKAAPMAQISR